MAPAPVPTLGTTRGQLDAVIRYPGSSNATRIRGWVPHVRDADPFVVHEQKISDAGHHDEIVSLPSASNYFSIFNRVLLHLIVEVCRHDRD